MKKLIPILLLLSLAACSKHALVAEDKPRFAKGDKNLVPEEPTPVPRPKSKPVPADSEEWGEQFFKKGDYKRAVAYLSQAVKKNQDSAKLWRNLG
jgi:Flp pilus assembly protein TadD